MLGIVVFGYMNGMLEGMLSSAVSGGDDLYLPVATGRYHFTGQNCAELTGPGDFEVREDNRSRWLVLVYEWKESSLLVY